jgi:hypothetical protein
MSDISLSESTGAAAPTPARPPLPTEPPPVQPASAPSASPAALAPAPPPPRELTAQQRADLAQLSQQVRINLPLVHEGKIVDRWEQV